MTDVERTEKYVWSPQRKSDLQFYQHFQEGERGMEGRNEKYLLLLYIAS